MTRLSLAWLAAVLAVTVLISVIQTQINLAALGALGVPISLLIRLETTLFDLWSFGGRFVLVMAIGLLIAFVVAALISRWQPRWRPIWFALAGFVAVGAAMLTINAMMPMTLIAATRSLTGLVLMCLAGALAGGVFLALARQRQNGRT